MHSSIIFLALAALSVADTTPDTDQTFLSNQTYHETSLAASVPSGYVNTFTDLQASSNAHGYMGYSVLASYDTLVCSEKCNAISGCMAFNIYFERDPAVDPTDDNKNPSSVTNIKCVIWGGPVTPENTVNSGGYNRDFHIVVAGSNGYQNKSIVTSTEYKFVEYLGNAGIQAPLDCNGHDTYMGVKFFDSTPFDVSLCADACTAANDYARGVGDTKTCQFFNTYRLLKNNQPAGQYCTLYNTTWPESYATNTGNGENTIAYSYGYSNATDAGIPTCS